MTGPAGQRLPTSGCYSGRVIGTRTEGGTPRFEVHLHAFPADEVFVARIAVPFAGVDRGAWLLPQVDDEVLVTFANGDPDEPVIVGSLWNGTAQPAEEMADSGPDVWALQGVNGTRIAIEESGGDAVRLTTPGGRELAISDGDAAITISDGSHSITIDAGGITIDGTAQVSVTAASALQITAPTITVDAGIANFSGMITCQTIQATTVIGTTYTPGAGNIW